MLLKFSFDPGFYKNTYTICHKNPFNSKNALYTIEVSNGKNEKYTVGC